MTRTVAERLRAPLECDEPDDYRTFRLGLFEFDKPHDRAVENLSTALNAITGATNVP